MRKVALFPGSFDPITKGHLDIVSRGLALFDEIVVGVGINANKTYMFTVEQRMKFIRDAFAHLPQVKVISFVGLTVSQCESIGARYILRGLRNPADFEFEKAIAQMNRAMVPTVETVFLLTSPELSAISSSIIRDIYRNGGDVTQFLPERVSLS